MPVNKAARFRFEIIDECLRNTRKKWSKKELLKYVNRRLELQYGVEAIISISQIRYDIENMQSDYSAPIDIYKVGRSYYYRYEDENFSIRNIPINEEEISSLNVAVQLLKQIKWFSIADEVADIVTKLEARYNFNVGDQREIIIFESAQNDSGKVYLEDIYHAIVRKNVLKISYRAPASRSYKIVNVHPYLLKEYNNIWHLVGYCQELKKIGVYELDCISEVKISQLPYIADLFLNVDSYFKDIIGISRPSEDTEAVCLLFDRHIADSIILYPIHHTQKVIQQHDDGSAKIELKVIINQELINLLLGYGQHVTVLSPGKLASEIYFIAEKIINGYSMP